MLLELLVLISVASACPFYTTNRGSRTNYTDFASALPHGNLTFPIRVCDGSSSNATADLIISNDVAVIGDTDACGGGAYWNVHEWGFTLNGTANARFQNIRFIFNATLFTVVDSAELTLTNVNMLNGVTAIVLSPSFLNQSPFIGTGVMFQFMDVGIQLSRALTVACQYCRFQSLKVAAITTPSSDISALSLPYVVAEDVIVFVALKASTAITPISIPDSFVLCHELATCHSYDSTCAAAAESQSPVFGSGVGGNGSSKKASCSDCTTEKWLLVGLFILVGIVSIAMIVRTVDSRKTYGAQINNK